ncbi:MAG: hypothetical protein AAGF23_25060, partial [Acidobacteriota bacterium]
MGRDDDESGDGPDRAASSFESAGEAVRGILGGLGKISARLEEVAEKASDALSEAEKRRGDGESGVVYDVSVRFATDGQSVRRPGASPSSRAGAARGRGEGAASKARRGKPPGGSPGPVREPYAEIQRDGQRLTVVLDMPGVEASDVEVEVAPGQIEVRGQGGDRRWAKRLEVADLPAFPAG